LQIPACTYCIWQKQEWKDGKYVDTEEDNVINDVNPLWKQKPADLKDEDYRLDLRLYGAKLLLPMTTKKTVSVDVPRNMHLSGKGIKGSTVIEASPDIKKDDIILIRVNENFNGLGVAKADAADIKNPSQNTIKIRKIGGGIIRLNEEAQHYRGCRGRQS